MERYIESLDWITLLLVSCLVLYAVAKSSYPRRFHEFIMLPLNSKYFFVHGKNDDIKHPFNLLLFIAQVISVSLFIFLYVKIKSPNILESNPWLFVQICSAYTFFVLIKLILEKIVGTIFNLDTIINSYLYQKLSYRNLMSILLFIGNLIFFYAVDPTLNLITIFVVLIILLNCIALYNSYKTFGNLILSNFFYFILYLCALEISPYIILYKAFQ
ncbi:DUF4271 domain-containing protein [Ulvibacter antarcticus]|uniref:Uncharacterized protein DUF4271 n=1 Tax=Ulvibacter antarcticus TaxID=442714 RepID=A0A3L9Z0G7_9FLAO|nr:uncharacterized protein DUF4271 [Ulvibacter antarcticus]